MTLQNIFDLAKKRLDGGNLKDGFRAKNGTLYHAYYTNDEWHEFIESMKRHHNRAYEEYRRGDGGELSEKQYPPKMASYGSSSRLIFELSKGITGFQFEKKLGISISARNKSQETEVSLDGFHEDKNIFVEAKCHEIYSRSHPKFNAKYEDFYQYLSNKTGKRFRFDVKATTNKKGEIIKHVYFSWDGIPIVQLDLKQILCHLLGIAKWSILEEGRQTPTLLYLVYKPSKLLEFVDSKASAASILACWETEKREATTIDLPLVYNSVVHFLYERKGIGLHLSLQEIEHISGSFVFRFCDQENYHFSI